MIKTISNVQKVISKLNYQNTRPFFSKKDGNTEKKVEQQQQEQKSEGENIKNVQNDGTQSIKVEHPLENLFLQFNERKNIYLNTFQDYNFEKDMQPTIKKFEQIGFNKTYFTQLYKYSPFSLVNKSNTNYKSDISEVTEFLSKELKIEDHQIKHVVLKLPEIIEIGIPEFKNRIQYLKEKFEYNDKQVQHIITYYPQILNKDYVKNINDKLHIVQSWLQMTNEQISQITLQFPWIFGVETTQFRDNIKTLTSRGFSQENIITIMQKDPEFLALSTKNLEHAFQIPTRVLNIPNPVYVSHMTEDPRLLTLCPTSIMPVKHQIMMDDYLIPLETVRQIYIDHPQVFVKSINSLRIKLKYLTERYKMKILKDDAFPAILEKNYQDFIRPRGEAMIKTQNFYEFSNVLKMSEEEFIKKIDISKQDFEKIKNIIAPSEELDFKKKPHHKYFGTQYEQYKRNFSQLKF